MGVFICTSERQRKEKTDIVEKERKREVVKRRQRDSVSAER